MGLPFTSAIPAKTNVLATKACRRIAHGVALELCEMMSCYMRRKIVYLLTRIGYLVGLKLDSERKGKQLV